MDKYPINDKCVNSEEEHNEITKQVKITRDENEYLKQKIKEVEERNSVISQFIANISHEIRTPMNGIIGTVELLENVGLTDEQSGYIKMLKTSSEALIKILGNALDMSMIESNNISLNESNFDIKEDISNIVNQLIFVGTKKNIKIMHYIEPFIETCVKGDKHKLNQVLINLMNNAIKYTEEGHIFLSVKKIGDYEGSVRYQFSIEDTGIGMEDSFISKMLSFFNQVNPSYDKNYYGVGLGLAISKRLVTMMNGEIWFESKKECGSTFYFTVEFKKFTSFQPQHKETKVISEIKEDLDKIPRILVVEDNEINKKLAVAFLSKKGYHTICANNGIEAIEEYNKKEVDLILMDIQMPEMNGFDATAKIRIIEKENGHKTPIIAMTAYAMTGDREKCLASGMDDYISKPINSEILYEKISKYLRMKKGSYSQI